MFERFTNALRYANRMTPFTRPDPLSGTPLRFVEGDRAEREREAWAQVRRFTFWV